MEAHAVAVIGSGAIGTVVSQLIPGAVLSGRRNLKPVFKGQAIENYFCGKNVITGSNTAIFCLKSYDMYQALIDYKPFMTPGQAVILMCNGFAHRTFSRRCLRDFPRVFAGFTTIAAVKTGNTAEMIAGGTVTLSPLNDKAGPAPVLPGISCSEGDYREQSWKKGLLNALVNLPSTLFETTNDELFAHQHMADLVADLHEELSLLCERLGLLAPSLSQLRSQVESTGKNVCSTLQDYRNGRPCELPHITGQMLKAANRSGFNAELLKALHYMVLDKFQARSKPENDKVDDSDLPAILKKTTSSLWLP
ncbi:MAG: ketopantoate reductase C-terminal domain-containing protein [Candidatus Wallbacteria bacterium]|nr:ketopantoate reductase C-terminal domain-containing protein [Candidatus Wallbacteria bacterium]